MGIRGGGRICTSLDISEGRVTSPPFRRERPARGSHRVQPGGQVSFPGAGDGGRAGTHTRKNSLSWGLLLSAGMCTVKRSKSSAPFRRSSITEASNRPAPTRTRGRERTVTHKGIWPPGHFSWSEEPTAPLPILLGIFLGSAWGEGLARRDQSPYSSIYQMFVEHLLCARFRR